MRMFYYPKACFVLAFLIFLSAYCKNHQAETGSDNSLGPQKESSEWHKKYYQAIQKGDDSIFYDNIPRSDLERLNDRQLNILANTPFAFKGHVFNTPWLKKYFHKFPWYKPKPGDVSNQLSENEIGTAQLIRAIQRERKGLPPLPVLGWSWSSGYTAGPGNSRAYKLCTDNTARFEYSDINTEIKKTGTYKVKGEKAIIQWTHEQGKEGYGNKVEGPSGSEFAKFKQFSRQIEQSETVNLPTTTGSYRGLRTGRSRLHYTPFCK